ncbi:hypothetical protein SRABI06_00566 [Pseudomonas brassicacearum]|nr:hypothetical protein SRABI06_00566 [Pseudomonas brassicacearum]
MVPLLQRVTFGKAPKVTKSALPHHSVPRLGSACPHSGIAPWAAAKGHPWPSAAIPASMPGCPLRNACVRPAWFNGAPRSRSRSRSKARARARARARAGYMPASMCLNLRYREQARSHRGSSADTKPIYTTKPVGAGLPAKRPAHPTSSSTMTPPSRAGSLPQWSCGEHKTHEHPRSPVGASLLAKRPAHPTSPQTDPPPSRASPLPQWSCGEHKTQNTQGHLWERACSR